MFLSIFELFKIGIGPSSSHTMGPMVAAHRFLEELRDGDWVRPAGSEVDRITVSLHGSLAFTGKGHASDRAVILGLMGQKPDTINIDEADSLIEKAHNDKKISAEGHPAYAFDPSTDLIFDYDEILTGHANGMRFNAYDINGGLLLRQVYYSIGGGFVQSEEELSNTIEEPIDALDTTIPFGFQNAKTMLEMAETHGLTIADMKRRNEETCGKRGKGELLGKEIRQIWQAMDSCIERGLRTDGTLPGGLEVPRRAPELHKKLKGTWAENMSDPLAANNWLSLYAMAVNEENAAGGKVVTAPTNGAAGVIPAVMKYYQQFVSGANEKGIEDFLLTASAVGGIIKRNASISGAEVGCQGEVGSASSMAAAGLTAVLGGTPEQIENAAEIALEHHLGMTCDPVGGLVQVPCIERNAMGAVKAVTAASLAMHGDGAHFMPLDNCIETMRQTGMDMDERYKETSQGGLAINIPSNVVEC